MQAVKRELTGARFDWCCCCVQTSSSMSDALCCLFGAQASLPATRIQPNTKGA